MSVTERINLTFLDHEDKDVELPFRILVLSDLTADETSESISDNPLIKVEHGVSHLLASLNVRFVQNYDNRLNPGSNTTIQLDYAFTSLDDFSPDNLVSGIPELSSVLHLHQQLGDESVKANRLLDPLGEFGFIGDESLDYNERLVIQNELQQRMNALLNDIFADSRFRALESSWRSLDYLDSHINYKENIELVVLNTSKQGLQEDFEDSPDATQSSLFQQIYSAEFGQFGGRPYSMMIGDFQFSHQSVDMVLLQSIAKVAALSHCPFISSADAKMFGIDRYAELSRIRDVTSHFDQAQYVKWNSFRENPDSRYVCLTMPKFLLRHDYDNQGSDFQFSEQVTQDENGLWGNAAFALATRFANSYAKFRWYINVTGEEFGLLNDLKVEANNKALRTQIPTQVMISDRSANELVKNGFTPLVIHRQSGKAGFMAAPSCKAIDDFGHTADGRQKALNQQIEIQLPYMLISCRFSQYIKVMQRENIGSWLTRSQIDQSLNRWLKQFVSDMDNPAPSVRARRPLRDARITVRDMEGKAGWFLSTVSITPHFKYMGQSFTLTERGRLEKA
jgi:type VI secretion system protein ImpC